MGHHGHMSVDRPPIALTVAGRFLVFVAGLGLAFRLPDLWRADPLSIVRIGTAFVGGVGLLFNRRWAWFVVLIHSSLTFSYALTFVARRPGSILQVTAFVAVPNALVFTALLLPASRRWLNHLAQSRPSSAP
jgi:hypothetical protein